MKTIENVEQQNNEKQQKRPLFSHSIYLIGFMGCGKSTVASSLSELLAMDTFELDSLLAEKEGMRIADIFSQYGEEYFREKESRLLLELEEENQSIISCGGGAAIREKNVESMKKNGRVILLTASPETIYERVKNSTDRPILNENMSIEYIQDLIERRREAYERAADIIVSTDNKSIPEISNEIIDKLGQLDAQ